MSLQFTSSFGKSVASQWIMAHLANFSEVLGCVSLLEASGNSMYIAKLCKGRTASGSACCGAAVLGFPPHPCIHRTCNDVTFPILDYDPAQKKCVCHRHPCWDDNGIQHKCPGENPEDTWQLELI